MSTATKDTDRLAAAHQALSDAIANVITSEDWQQLLRISQSFHRYSPNNQLLLAAPGNDDLVQVQVRKPRDTFHGRLREPGGERLSHRSLVGMT